MWVHTCGKYWCSDASIFHAAREKYESPICEEFVWKITRKRTKITALKIK